MVPAIRNWTRDEMMKRVAFFRDLKGSKTGLPDSNLPVRNGRTRQHDILDRSLSSKLGTAQYV
jgi:hypothetical protein